MKNKVLAIVIGGLLVFAAAATWVRSRASAFAPPTGGGPYSNQPLALTWDDSLLAAVNPEAGTVSIFQVGGDKNTKMTEVPVGKEPAGVAWSSDGSTLYVANQADGVVAVVQQYLGAFAVAGTIPVGTEPHGMVLSASGRKLYVTNTRSNNVSVIDTTTNKVTATVAGVGPEPRGIAITHGPGITADSAQTVYVTDFLALPSGNGHPDGFDDAKTGFVTAISVANDTVIGTIKLNTVADTGFKAAGDALMKIAPPATPQATDFTFTTGAYPNQLNNLATHGKFAYVPSTGASPNGPVRFNVNMQSLVNVIDLTTNKDAGQTINMQSAVGAQTNPSKLFVTQPWAIAFKNNSDQGYVAGAASNVVVKLAVDPTLGKPTVQNDPSDATRVLEIPVGKNPRGIVINGSDTRAYVWNYVSRDVSVIDLTQSPEKVTATLSSSALPQPGTPEDRVHIGRELFFTSVGVFDPPAAGQPPITGRMSNNGWGSCGACHPFGLTDNVVWIFAAGPRRTVPLHSTFVKGDPTQQRALNWSAILDEVEDFEGNIRNVSGGLGLFVQADGVTQAPLPPAFIPAAGGLNQLKVRGVASWDAIKAYVQSGIRAPLSPASKTDPDIAAGRQLFIQANCQNCHGTALWTTSRVRYTAPPDASLVQNAQLIAELRPVGTFDPKAGNEVRQNAAAPLGPDGFNPPSLLSIFAFPQTFFHGGSAASLSDVLANTAHRTAGGAATDVLSSPSAQAQLIKFLNSIDSTTAPINPPPPGALSLVNAASGKTGPQAVAGVVTAYGAGLAPSVISSPGLPLLSGLGGTTAAVQDSARVLRLAPLYFAAPGQVNFQVNPGTAAGAAAVTITSASGATSVATMQIVPTSPGIISANASGAGVAAATAVRFEADGVTQTPVPVFQCGNSGCTAVPMDVSTGTVYVTFYGTGVRGRSSLANVSCTVGSTSVTVLFAGDQGQFPGLDQLNVQLSPSLKGSGEVPVVFTVDGQPTNPVTINIQ